MDEYDLGYDPYHDASGDYYDLRDQFDEEYPPDKPRTGQMAPGSVLD
jgi:hypothetical protein